MRKSLARTVAAPAFLKWNAIANKRIFYRERSRWMTLSALSAFFLLTLITGFNAFLTPQKITQTKPLGSFGELDMSSDAFLYEVYKPMSPDVRRVDQLQYPKA